HVLQIVLRGFGTLLAKADIAIVDSAMISQPATRQEHRSLRRHSRFSSLYQNMCRITKRGARKFVVVRMLANGCRRVVAVRIDEQKFDPIYPEFLMQPANLWGVTIRNRALGTDENKDHGLIRHV